MRWQSFLSGAIVIIAAAGQKASFGGGFEGLGYLPGGTCSEATAVSAGGSVVVGTSCTASGVQAFRWTAAERIVGIPIPAGLVESWATDVSADGRYVLGHGRKSDSPPYEYEGFRWHVSGSLDRIAAPGLNTMAKGISGDGSIAVGTSWGTDIDEEVFRWTEAGGLGRLDGLLAEAARTNADAISHNGLVIVGDRIYDGPPYRDCFVWSEGEVLGFSAHAANATSSDGSVVVGGLDNQQTSLFEAYRWTAQTGTVLLGTCLPDYHSRALGVSGDGSIIVGYVQNNAGFDEQKAFIWDQGHGMRLLQDVLEDDFGFDLSGWKLAEPWASWKATGISQDGSTIVGVALNAEGKREAWRAVLRKIVYVDRDATGANNGSSWADAYDYLQDALADADSSPKPVEIRVAQGVYTPDSNSAEPNGTGDREAAFELINRVSLVGGYAGFGEIEPDARDVAAYETVLSGDLDGNDAQINDPRNLHEEPTRSDNSYHVVTGAYNDETAVLNGLTITGGNANAPGNDADGRGGGIYNQYGRPTLSNCTFRDNSAKWCGGGMHTVYGGLSLANCTFRNNMAVGKGGGLFNGVGAMALTNCTVSENYSVNRGGGIFSSYATATITNCIVTNNTADLHGGGMYIAWGGARPKISGCLISANHSRTGGGFYIDTTKAIIAHCIITGNRADNSGGGIYNWNADAILTNCTISGNVAAYAGGGIHSTYGSEVAFSDGIIFANMAEVGPELALAADRGMQSSLSVSYSNVLGGLAAIRIEPDCYLKWDRGNTDKDPCFADPGYWDPNGTPQNRNDDVWINGDYHLKSEGWRLDTNLKLWTYDDVTSLCIDAGSPDSPLAEEPLSVPPDPNSDWGQNLRLNMGAFGGTTQASIPPHGWALVADYSNDGIANFADFALWSLNHAYTPSESPAEHAAARTLNVANLALLVHHWLDQTTWFATLPPPAIAWNPNPPDRAVGIRLDTALSWQPGLGAKSHDIYFGTAYPPQFQASQTATEFYPGLLPEEATCYWRIDEVNAYGRTSGYVWIFTTKKSGTR
ncbi:MAG: hypothetical protein ISS79_12510 [Phycisphaerae bacterium]|nr:hypothetical protein [Phycisphaerae bacterium]